MEGMNQFPFAIVRIEIYDLRNHYVEFCGDAFRSLNKIIILMGKNKINSKRNGRLNKNRSHGNDEECFQIINSEHSS